MILTRLLRRDWEMPSTPPPGTCGLRRHALRTERLRFYTPLTQLDIVAAMAGAADPEAQRWLGWPDSEVVADVRAREILVNLRPGADGVRLPAGLPRRLLTRSFEPSPGRKESLVAVRLDDGRYAGCIGLSTDTGEVGGWLAPHARGLGLGRELFEAAARLGHSHNGLRTVRAGYEATNELSARALSDAGFTPTEGPPRHTLPNGREIDSRWVAHTTEDPTSHCRGSGLPAPRGSTGGRQPETPDCPDRRSRIRGQNA